MLQTVMMPPSSQQSESKSTFSRLHSPVNEALKVVYTNLRSSYNTCSSWVNRSIDLGCITLPRSAQLEQSRTYNSSDKIQISPVFHQIVNSMPAYEIEHICKLTDDQKDQLAEAITKIHSKQFSTPRLFVNVRITDISNQRTYVAGKQVIWSQCPSCIVRIQVIYIDTAQKQPHFCLRPPRSLTHTIRLQCHK